MTIQYIQYSIRLTELSKHGAQETQGEGVSVGQILKESLLFRIVLISSVVVVFRFQDALKQMQRCNAGVVHI